MKIAIIEDRISRLDQYSEFDLKSSKEVSIITGIKFDELILELEIDDTKELEKFECIATHRSALSNNIRSIIKNYCTINKKPLIFFSGGISSSVYKDSDFPFLHINSKDFYSINLKLFLEDFKENKSVNLLIIQFGKRWKLSLLLNLRNNILVSQNKQIIKNVNHKVEIDNSELIKRVRDLKINSLIKKDLLNDRTESFLLGDDFDQINDQQIEDVKSIISQLINELV